MEDDDGGFKIFQVSNERGPSVMEKGKIFFVTKKLSTDLQSSATVASDSSSFHQSWKAEGRGKMGRGGGLTNEFTEEMRSERRIRKVIWEMGFGFQNLSDGGLLLLFMA